MEEFKYQVFVRIDSNNVIIEMGSNLQDIDFANWIQIDEGTGDKYSHAQGNYFTLDEKEPLRDMQGKYNYKLVDNKVVELTDEEKASLFPTPISEPSLEEQIKLMREAMNELILGGM